jgi:hypothetical protein
MTRPERVTLIERFGFLRAILSGRPRSLTTPGRRLSGGQRRLGAEQCSVAVFDGGLDALHAGVRCNDRAS